MTVVPVRLPPILPVLDLLGGDVVRGVAGERESYRQINSQLVGTSRPVDVARALRTLVGHDVLYVADLDAIQSDKPQWNVIENLVRDGCRLIADAGTRTADRAARLIDAGVTDVVVALETLPGWQALDEVVAAIGSQRVTFSLDLKNGQAMAQMSSGGRADPLTIASRAIECGIRGLIVLDLAGVGVGGGVQTLDLCREIRDRHPGIPLITGGGVRTMADVDQLLRAGVDSVMVASALHQRRIGADEIALLQSRQSADPKLVHAGGVRYSENGSKRSGAS